jgi:hypothetical protein
MRRLMGGVLYTRRHPSVGVNGWKGRRGESTWEGLDKGWYSIVSATSQGIFSLLLYLVRRQKEEQLQEEASRAKSKRDGADAAAALFLLLLLPTGDVCLSPILSPPYVRNVQSRAEQSKKDGRASSSFRYSGTHTHPLTTAGPHIIFSLSLHLRQKFLSTTPITIQQEIQSAQLKIEQFFPKFFNIFFGVGNSICKISKNFPANVNRRH